MDVSIAPWAQSSNPEIKQTARTQLEPVGIREGRCRKQLAKLFRVSWLSPRAIETVLAGEQPANLTRQRPLDIDLPLCWDQQEALLGLSC